MAAAYCSKDSVQLGQALAALERRLVVGPPAGLRPHMEEGGAEHIAEAVDVGDAGDAAGVDVGGAEDAAGIEEQAGAGAHDYDESPNWDQNNGNGTACVLEGEQVRENNG